MQAFNVPLFIHAYSPSCSCLSHSLQSHIGSPVTGLSPTSTASAKGTSNPHVAHSTYCPRRRGTTCSATTLLSSHSRGVVALSNTLNFLLYLLKITRIEAIHVIARLALETVAAILSGRCILTRGIAVPVHLLIPLVPIHHMPTLKKHALLTSGLTSQNPLTICLPRSSR